ncbi:MAG: AAA family ATPase [Zoogloeaceae bacterium]|jgi:exonuclease SbcC|nr:AAA family ATPase [Zoogloeaceae bacterium]
MRILEIRLENLNSLLGRWTIDLTHPAYELDGIFAIVGPTGSGKSTILDAICLALYGRTPRLAKISSSENEIMSRPARTAFAEVTFTTGKGRFRCHWSQRRAKSGLLQAPRHEIVDADSGKILAHRLQEVALRIEDATGMDFGRFTRSMLLAQGEFAAFLGAKADERAPILEQITGTEIYSRISIAAHERHAREKRELERLEAECAEFPRLAAEEEAALALRLEQAIAAEAGLRREIDALTLAARWREHLDALEENLQQLARQRTALETRLAAFAPEQERLECANRALRLADDHARLMTLRQAEETERAALEAAQQARPAQKEGQRSTGAAWQAARQRWEACRAAQQAAQPTFDKVRELDLKLAEKSAVLQALAARIAAATTRLAALREDAARDQATHAAHSAERDRLRRLQEEKQADGLLVEAWSGLENRFAHLESLLLQDEARKRALAEAHAAKAEALRQREAAQARFTQASQEREQQAARLHAEESRLAATLQGRELAAWREELRARTTQAAALTQAMQGCARLDAAWKTIAALTEEQRALHARAVTLERELAQEEERQTQAETELRLAENQCLLLQKIESFEAARHSLREGEPCPLCGALSHPFAMPEALPEIGAARQQREAARQKREASLARLTDLRIAVARVVQDQERQEARLREEMEIVAHNPLTDGPADGNPAGGNPAGGNPAGGNPANDDFPSRLARRQAALRQAVAENTENMARCEATLREAETLLHTRETARKTLEAAGAALAEAERTMLHANHGRDTAQARLSTLCAEAEQARATLVEAIAALRQESPVDGDAPVPAEALPCADAFACLLLAFPAEGDGADTALDGDPVAFIRRLREKLLARRAAWLYRQAEITREEAAMTALARVGERRAGQIEAAAAELRQQTEDLRQREAENAALCAERRALFGERNPNREAERLTQALEEAEQQREAARQAAATAEQAFQTLETNLRELARKIAARAPELAAAQGDFAARLCANGFADLAQYRAASLPEAAHRALARQAQALVGEEAALARQEVEKKQEQARLLAEARTETRALPELQTALREKNQRMQETQQEIGALRQRLAHNEEQKRAHASRIAAREAQARERARWERLQALIGSADGKKYRNFAQGLTFERLIAHANRQLVKMTERYLLCCGKKNPLDLDIIDGDQAGEIRSTKTLSGGERFIVSLALALGLSSMAGSRMRVDSLFLDEGFGALDDDALDTALDTLLGLRREGKLIGVISHVPALRERIAARIRVEPQTGGTSSLIGPGVREESSR